MFAVANSPFFRNSLSTHCTPSFVTRNRKLTATWNTWKWKNNNLAYALRMWGITRANSIHNPIQYQRPNETNEFLRWTMMLTSDVKRCWFGWVNARDSSIREKEKSIRRYVTREAIANWNEINIYSIRFAPCRRCVRHRASSRFNWNSKQRKRKLSNRGIASHLIGTYGIMSVSSIA